MGGDGERGGAAVEDRDGAGADETCSSRGNSALALDGDLAPGDVVVCDDDGVVVVPADEADAECERAEQIVAREEEKRRRYER